MEPLVRLDERALQRAPVDRSVLIYILYRRGFAGGLLIVPETATTPLRPAE